MTSVYTDVLSDEEIHYLNQLPEVLAARGSLNSSFSVPVTDSIRAKLQSRFGVSLPSSIPMRWMKGDTAPHVDVGVSAFKNTYLMYLNDSPGEFIIDSHAYPIRANSGFVFNEGLFHETQHTEDQPRLLMGPMNEFAEPVGGSITGIHYYAFEEDAINQTNQLDFSSNYVILPIGGYTSWRIASSSYGPSSQAIVYTVGNTLDSSGNTAYYNLYPSAPCFREGTTILCQVDGIETQVPVEQLKTGTLVKTRLDGYKPVVLLGKGTIQNPGHDERTENRLYKCSPSKYPDLKEDLYITGCHSILEFPITEKQKEDTLRHLGKMFITDKKYRLMAYIDERAEPWNSEGVYTIWHFALENPDDGLNYGVYANGGLLVETCAIRTLKNKSNMTLLTSA